jgi:hypothetical protein
MPREEKKNMVKSTNASPGRSEDIISFLSDLPPISFSTVSVGDLAFPPDLYEKAETYPDAPIDQLFPIITARSAMNGPLFIVDGCKRFSRLLESRRQTCICGVFDGCIDEKLSGVLRIFLNKKRHRQMRECVRYYRWLVQNFDKNDLVAILGPLGFHSSLQSELESLAACSEDCITAIDEGRIGVRAAAELSCWPMDGQQAFFMCFRGINLSSQTQREFIEWVPEIAYEKTTSISHVLQSEKIQEIINDGILNNPQKIEAIRALFRSWKYPLFDEVLERWKRTASATSRSVLINEPSSQVVFMPSPAFEMNKLEIRITVNHPPAAQEIFRKLSEIPQSTWSQLIFPS